MTNDCVFCKIAGLKIPVPFVDERANAFMIADKNPIAPHHMLIIASEHWDDLGDLMTKTWDDGFVDVLHDMHEMVDAYVNKHGLDKTGYRLIINTGPDAGQTISHLHMHLIGGAPLKNDFGA